MRYRICGCLKLASGQQSRGHAAHGMIFTRKLAHGCLEDFCVPRASVAVSPHAQAGCESTSQCAEPSGFKFPHRLSQGACGACGIACWCQRCHVTSAAGHVGDTPRDCGANGSTMHDIAPVAACCVVPVDTPSHVPQACRPVLGRIAEFQAMLPRYCT